MVRAITISPARASGRHIGSRISRSRRGHIRRSSPAACARAARSRLFRFRACRPCVTTLLTDTRAGRILHGASAYVPEREIDARLRERGALLTEAFGRRSPRARHASDSAAPPATLPFTRHAISAAAGAEARYARPPRGRPTTRRRHIHGMRARRALPLGSLGMLRP